MSYQYVDPDKELISGISKFFICSFAVGSIIISIAMTLDAREDRRAIECNLSPFTYYKWDKNNGNECTPIKPKNMDMTP